MTRFLSRMLPLVCVISLQSNVSWAEPGTWVAPDNGVAGLMSGSTGDNGYGLGSLMAQQGMSRSSGDHSSLGGITSGSTVGSNSVMSGHHSNSTIVAARKTMRAQNRDLKQQIANLTAQVKDQKEKLLRASSASEGAITASAMTVKQQSAELAALRQQLSDSQGQLSNSRNQLSAMNTRLAITERECQDLEARLKTGSTASANEVRMAKKAEQVVQQKVEMLTVQLATNQKQLLDAQAKLVDIQKQSEAVRAKVKTLTATLTSVTAARDTALAGQKAAETARQATEVKLADLAQQATNDDRARTQLESALKEARSQLAQANDRISKAGKVQEVPLDSQVRKESYVVGQAMAAGLREKLNGYKATGLELDTIRVRAGLSDGLQEKMKLPRKDMDQYWKSFADRMTAQVAARVKEGEKLIAAKLKGSKPDLMADGIAFVVTKKGRAIKDAEAPVTLSMKEQIADGRVISQLPSLTLSADDDIPAVVRDALPLLGEGAEVTAWAPAKVVYGDRPLPQGVMPFTVLEYHMQGLKAK